MKTPMFINMLIGVAPIAFTGRLAPYTEVKTGGKNGWIMAGPAV